MTVTTLQGFSELYLRYSSNFQPGFIFCFYNAVLAFGVQQSDSVTHGPTFRIGHGKVLSGVPCAAQEALLMPIFLFRLITLELLQPYTACFLALT